MNTDELIQQVSDYINRRKIDVPDSTLQSVTVSVIYNYHIGAAPAASIQTFRLADGKVTVVFPPSQTFPDIVDTNVPGKVEP